MGRSVVPKPGSCCPMRPDVLPYVLPSRERHIAFFCGSCACGACWLSTHRLLKPKTQSSSSSLARLHSRKSSRVDSSQAGERLREFGWAHPCQTAARRFGQALCGARLAGTQRSRFAPTIFETSSLSFLSFPSFACFPCLPFWWAPAFWAKRRCRPEHSLSTVLRVALHSERFCGSVQAALSTTLTLSSRLSSRLSSTLVIASFPEFLAQILATRLGLATCDPFHPFHPLHPLPSQHASIFF